MGEVSLIKLTQGKPAKPNRPQAGRWGEAPRPGGSTLAFPEEIPAPGLCLLGEFFEQPRSPAPGGCAAASAHPPPPSLARDSRGPVNAGERERRGQGLRAASRGTPRRPAGRLRELCCRPSCRGARGSARWPPGSSSPGRYGFSHPSPGSFSLVAEPRSPPRGLAWE